MSQFTTNRAWALVRKDTNVIPIEYVYPLPHVTVYATRALARKAKAKFMNGCEYKIIQVYVNTVNEL